MIEWVFITFYIALIFTVAFLAREKKGEKEGKSLLEEQYLAGRSLGFWETLGSIVATETSALTFLGLPAYAFSKDFSFIHIYIGAIIGRFLIAQVELPAVYNKGVTLYEVIAKAKGSSATSRKALSLVYATTKVLSVGVRLYMGSILLSEFFQLPIALSSGITVLLSLIYTMIGGLKAVVRTDLIQMIVLLTGGFVALWMIPQVANQDFFSLWERASLGGKTSLFGNWKELLAGFLGGIIFDIGTHGMDQDYMQRLMGCRSLKTAQRVIISSSALSIFTGILFLSVGALLWAFSQSNPLPSDLKSDQVFAYFITQYFPTPIKGLMLAGVLAATMSTIDSTINAVSSCISNDLFQRSSYGHIKRGVFSDLIIIAFLLFAVSLFASQFDQVLILGLKIASWIGGFFITFLFTQVLSKGSFFKKMTFWRVLLIFSVNTICVWINVHYKGAWQFNPFWGLVGGVITSALLGFYDRHREI